MQEPKKTGGLWGLRSDLGLWLQQWDGSNLIMGTWASHSTPCRPLEADPLSCFTLPCFKCPESNQRVPLS